MEENNIDEKDIAMRAMLSKPILKARYIAENENVNPHDKRVALVRLTMFGNLMVALTGGYPKNISIKDHSRSKTGIQISRMIRQENIRLILLLGDTEDQQSDVNINYGLKEMVHFMDRMQNLVFTEPREKEALAKAMDSIMKGN